MSNTVMFKIDTEGNLKCLHTPVTKAMFPEPASILRASHVVPMNPWLRFWFKALRSLFGDKGRVSDWTRNWYCLWKVDFSPIGGKTYGWFETRDRAIKFEIEYLNKNFLGV